MAGQYQTRCPHCSATFSVTDEHLGQARGAVRCGACLQIFQATDHLLGEPTGDSPPHPAPEPTGETAGGAPNDDLGDLQLSDSFLALDGDGSRSLSEDFSDMNGAGRGAHHGRSDEAWAEALLQDLEDETEPASAPPSRAEAPVAPSVHPASDTTAAVPGPLDFLAPTPSSRELANERLDDAARKRRRRRHRAGSLLAWSLASLLALLVLTGQYAWFHRDTLARSPQWRPLYAQACTWLHCQLPPLADLSVLRGSNLVVRSNPDYLSALTVDAMLHNDGSWPQPFPLLELTFSDLQGRPVASRRFSANEYLHGRAAGMRLMPVDTPVHVSLDIVDPGQQAVSYHLRLLPAE